MKYCPKCKEEYEDSASICGDCKIDLVSNIEEAKLYKPIVEVKKAELDELLKYMEYSNIKDYKLEGNEADNTAVKVLVGEEEYDNAHKFISIYALENMNKEDKKDEFYFDEYKTEKTDVDNVVGELKGSVYSFYILGACLISFSILSYIGILKTAFYSNTILLITMFILGIASFYIGYNSSQKAKIAEKLIGEKADRVESILNEFLSMNETASYLIKNEIQLDDLDEGAKYFAIFDQIKNDIKKAYPDEDDAIINSVSDRYYELLNK